MTFAKLSIMDPLMTSGLIFNRHAGRDSLPSLAVLVKNTGRRRYVDKSMTEYSNNDVACR